MVSIDSTSVVELLRDNTVPSGPQISQISRYIDDQEEEIRRLNIEIARLHDTLSKLKEDRERLQECCKQGQGLFAPIRKLPIEILAEIFSISSSESINFEEVVGPGYYRALRISQVCHHWREITKSTPQMWAGGVWEVCLNIREDICTSRISLISYYLHMSQPLPLAIQIRELPKWESPWWSDLYPPRLDLLRVLLAHSQRWLSAQMYLHVSQRKVIHEELQSRLPPGDGNGYFPNLQSLSLSCWEDQQIDSIDLDVFQITPNLTSLAALIPGVFVFRFPYSQFTGLSCSRPDILSQCVNIVWLRLTIRENMDLTQTLLPAYPILSTLNIDGNFLGGYSWAFRTLTLPSLVVLRIFACDLVGGAVELPSEDFRSLISRSGCTLQILHLSGRISMTRDQLDKFFRSIPSLIEFKVFWGTSSWREASIASLDLLTIDSSTQNIDLEDVLLPSLSHFELCLPISSSFRLVDDKFAVMAKSRQPPPIPGISCLAVSHCEECPTPSDWLRD